MNLRKFIVLILASLICLLPLVSCQNTSDDSDISGSSATDSSEESAEEDNMPEYWGFNDYERTEIVGAPEEILSHPTTVTKETESKYIMSCETVAGMLSITLEERPWGCFNLWSWRLVDTDGKEQVFAAGSTDFEYVHKINTPDGQSVWSGGNHGNEAFVSLDLYNAETFEKIELNVGDSVTVNSLHVIEKTKLLWTNDTDNDSIADYNNKNLTYTEDDVYAELTRKYTFTGPQIKLNVDYNYLKDLTHNHSYTGMLPINKKYGLWCEMYNHEGTLVNTIETSKFGKADYSGPMNGGNSASRVVIYGMFRPEYRIDVRVTTLADSIDNYNGTLKTAFWDMNTTYNKLYFSKFSQTETATIKAGTEFHTECIWLFNYVEGATTPED